MTLDNRTVAAGYLDGNVRFFDVETRSLLPRAPLQHGARVWTIAYSPDGKTLLTCGDDKSVRFWNAETGEADARPALMHQGTVVRAVFSDDGKLIATASLDHTAGVWDAETGYPIGRPLRHDAQVFGIAFHPNGREIFTGSEVRSDGVRRWFIPVPMEGDVDQLVPRIEAMTGLKKDSNRSITPLGRSEWEERISNRVSQESSESE